MHLPKKRFSWAVAISVLLHGAFFVFIGFQRFLPPSQAEPIIELQILSQQPPTSNDAPLLPKVSPKSESNPTNPIINSSAPLPKKSIRHSQATNISKKIQKSSLKKSSPSTSMSPPPLQMKNQLSQAPGSDVTSLSPSSDAPSSNGEPKKLRTQMNFSDFTEVLGEKAKSDRKAYQQHSNNKRRGSGKKKATSKQVQAALRNNHSILGGADVIPSGKKNASIKDYMKQLHRKIGPRFSTFLDSLDSINERMHKKIQNSPLRHNPFYVPPPESERQLGMRAPMDNLSMNATAEFEILPNGQLAAIRLIRTSNQTLFDAAAVDAVIKSAPFIPPPKRLLSKNNRSYVQWTFQRDWKKNNSSQGRLYLIGAATDTDIQLELK